MRCQQHGGHPALLVCEHLREAMSLRAPLPEVFYVEAWYLNQPACGHYLCPLCAEDNHISENPTIWRDDDSLDRLFLMKCNVMPACSKCFDEAVKRPVA